MQRHPARRAHILALIGAAFLIITVGSTALKLENQLIHYENLNHENASAASYIYRLQNAVGNIRACFYAYRATHQRKFSQCYNDAIASLLNNFSNFSFYRSIDLKEGHVRPNLMDVVKSDLEKIFTWPHSDQSNLYYDGQTIDELDHALSEIYHVTSRDYSVRLVDIVRATSLERILGLLGGVIGVISLISAGWVLDRSLLAFRRAESDARDLAGRFRAVLENLTIGVAVFGADGRLWHWNNQFGKLLGLSKDALKEGLSYNALCVMMVSDGLPLPDPFEVIEKKLSFGEKMSPEIVEYKSRHGAEMELGRNLFFDSKDPNIWRGLVVTISDITMRLRSERAIGEGKKLRAIGQLTAGVAHDFKNFLTIILGNIELAQQVKGTQAEEKRDKYLRIASDAVQHSETLTRQLLTFTRRKNAVSDVVDPHQLFPFLCELLERVIGRSIKLSFNISEDIWCLRGDGAQLECVLINLAINARDAMPGGGGLVISARNIEFESPTNIKKLPLERNRNRRVVSGNGLLHAGRWVRIDVADTGLGMSQDIMEQLFVPFFTTKEEGKGTGLGMAMVISCLKEVGGYLMVESGVGVGTCVSLWLPAIACSIEEKTSTHVKETSKQITPDEKKTSTVQENKKKNILIIEDDSAIANIIASILSSDGFDVKSCQTAQEGLSILASQKKDIHLLVTDIELPGSIDGIAISQYGRKENPQLPVVYVSGNIKAAQQRGVQGSIKLRKPFGRHDLIRVVYQALGIEGQDKENLSHA